MTDYNDHQVRVEIERWMIETSLVDHFSADTTVDYVLECRLQPLRNVVVGARTLPGLIHEGPIQIVGHLERFTLVEVQSLVVVLNQVDATTFDDGQSRQHWLTFSPYQARLRAMLATQKAVPTRWKVAGIWEFAPDNTQGPMQPRRELPSDEELNRDPRSLFAVDLHQSE